MSTVTPTWSALVASTQALLCSLLSRPAAHLTASGMFDGVVLFNRFGRLSHQVLANSSLLVPLGPQLVADFARSSVDAPARIDISGRHYVVFRRTVSRFELIYLLHEKSISIHPCSVSSSFTATTADRRHGITVNSLPFGVCGLS